jgi:predicted regulator of Ras-like GTPase activity (Roadblock/LC7/MglB family)
MEQQLSKEAQSVNWLVSSFVRRVPGVAHAIVVSSDGLLTSVSERLDRTRADQLAAVASGLVSLTRGAAKAFGGGTVNQVAVEMERGFLLMTGSPMARRWPRWQRRASTSGRSATRWRWSPRSAARRSRRRCAPSSRPRYRGR